MSFANTLGIKNLCLGPGLVLNSVDGVLLSMCSSLKIDRQRTIVNILKKL